MILKSPELLGVAIKAGRGLAYHEAAYAMRPEMVSIIATFLADGVELTPGTETAVLVPLPNVPPDADVKEIKASLIVSDSQNTLPPTGVSVQRGDAPAETFELSVNSPTGPRNVSIRLDQGEVFYTAAGPLASKSYPIPDFAAQANAYLDRATPTENQVTLQFLVKSDTPGRVKIEIQTPVVFSRLQTQTWENAMDDTIRLDRNAPIDFGTIERFPLDALHNPGGRSFALSAVTLDIGGQIGPERLLGSEVIAPDGAQFATIGSDYALAQGFQLETPARLAGVSGYFRIEAEAELYVEAQADANGVPASGAPLAKANATLPPLEAGETGRWVYIAFESPTDVKAGQPYWIVLKGIRGKALLGVQTAPPDHQSAVLFNRGGQLWKNLRRPSDSALGLHLGLVYLPDVDNQTAAVEIGLEGAAAFQRIDPGSVASEVSVAGASGAAHPATLIIRSRARGVLSIANVIQEYKPM